jgi:deoxyribodipyrimidine photo-lyase
MEKRKLQLYTPLNIDGNCVVYVMSRDQRVNDNHALLLAQQSAINKKLPLLVVFNLLEKAGVRAQEHYRFMLEGLKFVEKDLSKINIGFRLTFSNTSKEFSQTLKEFSPAEAYFDFNALKPVRNWQKSVASNLEFPSFVVDTHNIIPAWIISDKEEFAAHTMRNKVHKKLAGWLEEPGSIKVHPYNTETSSIADWEKADKIVGKIQKNNSNISLQPGELAANKQLKTFIDQTLPSYAADRNNPNLSGQSELSPYLHFGQISSLRVALNLIKISESPPLLLRQAKLASYEGEPSLEDSIDAFLEELMVRKELSDNFCLYNENYDNFEGGKDWAKDSLNQHKNDTREFTYSRAEFESANTHDDAWNAAQNQMMKSGKMHGYMRMYWAKKILEWSTSPEEAIKTAVYLNDHYSIDGGDPNGYTGILWSIVGIHDRPWFERQIFGKIRYMNRGGLERKFDVEEYIKSWL